MTTSMAASRTITPRIGAPAIARNFVKHETKRLGPATDLNTINSVIYSSAEGSFTASAGTVSVSPIKAANKLIPAGTTNSAITFCANRPSGAGTATIVATSGNL